MKRRTAVLAALLAALLLPVSGCSQSQVDARGAAEPASTGAGPASPTSPSATAPPSASPALQGGGFASALPSSDAPGRRQKGDTGGPQFQLSTSEPNIKEIERLVRAVEKVAKQFAVEQPRAVDQSLATAVGTFTYRYFADGSVAPDPDWVASQIRTGSVPVLGQVTCHKVLFPQLRAALQEIVDRGLAEQIIPDQFGGCYVPRFIGRNPERGLSLHTWGIAVDLNVPGNLRGTTGRINRDVVSVLKKWGFAWGGDWSYTDPMHFELAALVTPR